MNKVFIVLTIIITVLFSLVEFLIVFDEVGSIPDFIFFAQLILKTIPILVLLFINFLAKKFNWKKVITIIVNILFLVLTFFYFFFISFVSMAVFLFWDTTPKIPKQDNYVKSLSKIKSQYRDNEFDHFPDVLPKNITDYYFFIENSFDGEDTHYLKFRTDSSYINNELKEKCNNKTVPKNTISEWFYTCKFPEVNEYCILHRAQTGERYSTGIATNKERNIIYYFYANY